MKIKMVGTGALTGKSRSSSVLIENSVLIDCGNGIFKTMLEQQIDIESISYLFVTHMHADHFFDIPFLILYRNIKGIMSPLNIYVPLGEKDTLYKLFNIAYPDINNWDTIMKKTNVNIYEYNSENENNTSIGLNVKAVKVAHGNFENSYGFVVKNETNSLFISGDSSYCDQVEKMILETKASILDISFIQSKPSHMGINDLEKIIKYCNNKKIITIHMTPEAKEKIIELNEKNIIIPNDGDEFSV